MLFYFADSIIRFIAVNVLLIFYLIFSLFYCRTYLEYYVLGIYFTAKYQIEDKYVIVFFFPLIIIHCRWVIQLLDIGLFALYRTFILIE